MSLTNPYVLLGIVLAVLSAFGSGYYKGGEDERVEQELEIASLNAQARQKEQALVAAVNTTANVLRKTNEKAKTDAQKRNSAIDDGTFKLRVPVKTTCAVPTSPDTPAPSGDSGGEARAELDPAFGKAIFEITDEGNRAIEKLNACITLYNQAIESQKGIK